MGPLKHPQQIAGCKPFSLFWHMLDHIPRLSLLSFCCPPPYAYPTSVAELRRSRKSASRIRCHDPGYGCGQCSQCRQLRRPCLCQNIRPQVGSLARLSLENGGQVSDKLSAWRSRCTDLQAKGCTERQLYKMHWCTWAAEHPALFRACNIGWF